MSEMITDGDFSVRSGPFEPNLESLGEFECPEWFIDAKFGIWSHWGPQSVPMFGDWYARNIYIEGSDQYRYHIRRYGHPSEFGYKDIVKLWKAEKFNPGGLMKKFVDAGAQYFVAQAMHHDNFDNFDSKYQPRFNAVNMGPERDIVGEWKEAAAKHNLPFGVTEHHGASYGWFGVNKGCDLNGMYRGVPYDGNDAEYADLYYPGNNGYELRKDGWYADNEDFHRNWFLRIRDVIDKYQPDLLYSDGPLPFDQYGLDMVAHLYNTSAAKNGGRNRAIYTQKDPARLYASEKAKKLLSIGVLDLERSQEEEITAYYWQTDTSVGDWFYNVKDRYKPWNVIMETIIDIASKNGNILLNIPQKPDGTLDDECEFLLEKLAEWMKVNGEGLFGTRHWRKSGEGEGRFEKEGGFDERAVDWRPGDLRFTCRDNTVYAFLMRWPGRDAIIRSLPANRERVRAVSLLGYGSVEYEQNGAGLNVNLPDRMPAEFVTCLKIDLDC